MPRQRDRSVAGKIAELKAPEPDDRARRIEILELLPLELPAPTVSNTGKTYEYIAGWLGFDPWESRYDKDNDPYEAANILDALHRHGFQTVPLSLVKWDDYRRSVFAGTHEQIPDEHPNSKYKLTDHQEIAPVWIEPSYHTQPEAWCILQAPNGMFFKVHLEMLGMPIGLSAKRVEYRGGWRYEPNTARLRFPDGYEELRDAQGNTLAVRSARTFAHVPQWGSPQQYIEGRFYWDMTVEWKDFHWSAGQMLRAIIDAGIQPKQKEQ